MPRDTAGVYTIPGPALTLSPVPAPNGTIVSAEELFVRGDIAQALTDSLDRNGTGGMLAPFRVADGTQAAPGLAFLAEPGSGMYRISSGDWALAVQGTMVMQLTPGYITFPNGVGVRAVGFTTGGLGAIGTLQFNKPDGINSWYFNGTNGVDPNLIIDILGVGTTFRSPGGVDQFSITPAGITSHNNLSLAAGKSLVLSGAGAQIIASAATSPGFTFNGDGDTGLGWLAADTFEVLVGAQSLLRFTKNTGGTADSLLMSSDVGAGPYFRPIVGGRNLGLRGSTNDASAYAAIFQRLDGATIGFVRNDGVAQFNGGVVVAAGTNVWLDGGSDTFICETSANVVDIVCGGSPSGRFLATGVAVQSGDMFYFDGGGDTNMSEGPANVITVICGNALSARFWPNGFSIPPLSLLYFDDGSNTFMKEVSGDTLATFTGGVERMRLNANGFFKASNRATYNAPNTGPHEFDTNNDTGQEILALRHAGATPGNQYGLSCQLVGDPNNATNFFFSGVGFLSSRFTARANGGLANFQANDVNLSDVTIKDNWEPYSVAQLEALSVAVDALDFGRYKYRDQTHDDWNHGYTAQNVREAFAAAAPELVDVWGGRDDDTMKDLLAVYSTDFVNINLAVARHEIRKLKDRVAQLEAGVH